MAGELTLTGSLTHVATGVSTPSVSALAINQSGTRYVMGRQKIGTTEEAIQLGELAGTVLGCAVVKNLDATNFIEILDGSGGTAVLKLKPGEGYPFRFGSGITAPYAIANTAECTLEYRIHED